jgi:hypothetical protein
MLQQQSVKDWPEIVHCRTIRRSKIPSEDAAQNQQALERFRREARAASANLVCSICERSGSQFST